MTNPLWRAIVVIIMGLFAFEMMGVIVRTLGSHYSILQISVLRNFFGIIPAALLLMLGPGLAGLKTIRHKRDFLVILLRSGAVLMAQISFYTALTKIEFATAGALGFTSPLFITLLSIPILGTQVGWVRISAVILGFAGVLMIMKPFNEAFSYWMILPVIAGFGYGLANVLVRLFPSEIPSSAIQIGQQLTTCAMALIALVFTGEITPINSTNDMGLFVLMGCCGGLGVMSLVIAYRLVEPSTLAAFEYFGIPISFLLGYVFFAEAPFGTLFPGVLLIVAAGMLIIIRERRKGAVDQRP